MNSAATLLICCDECTMSKARAINPTNHRHWSKFFPQTLFGRRWDLGASYEPPRSLGKRETGRSKSAKLSSFRKTTFTLRHQGTLAVDNKWMMYASFLISKGCKEIVRVHNFLWWRLGSRKRAQDGSIARRRGGLRTPHHRRLRG